MRPRLIVPAVLLAVAGVVAYVVLTRTVFAPPTGDPDTTTVSVIAGDVAVQQYQQLQFVPVKERTSLQAGDQVRTGPDSYAVITFFEGSTLEMEPDTWVTITSQLRGHPNQPAATAITVRQQAGTTWNRVQHLAAPSSIYQIDTPAASVIARRTLIGVTVDPDTGRTEAWSEEDVGVVRAQGSEVELQPFTRTVIETGQAPPPPTSIAPARERIELSMTSRIWLRVVDPIGRTVGFAPPGLGVNQVPGGAVSLPFVRPTTLSVPVTMPGDYTIIIEPAAEGDYQFVAQGISGGNPVFRQGFQGAIRWGLEFAGTLTVGVEDGRLTKGILSPFRTVKPAEALLLPGKVVKPRQAQAGVSQTATAIAVEGTPTPFATRTPTPTRTSTPTPQPTPTPNVLTATPTPRPPAPAAVPTTPAQAQPTAAPGQPAPTAPASPAPSARP